MQKIPLHLRIRPKNLEEFIGQEHFLGENKFLRKLIKEDRLTSLIFYGPPGVGKTTLALCIKNETQSYFSYINGADSNLEKLKSEINLAEFRFKQTHKKTILFVDEIHHFNKRQQDIFLPVLEENFLILIGATIHNPFFYLISPLLSRVTVLEFKPFSKEEILKILKRALKDERGLGKEKIEIKEKVLEFIAENCEGDARKALNILELAFLISKDKEKTILTLESVKEAMQKKVIYYDKDEDYHYDLTSALIKSIRASKPDAAIYYLAKMLEGGESPLFIARRLVISACEDIGLADPFALVLASACAQSVHFVGMPEAELILAETVIYLAKAKKSNSALQALLKAKEDIKNERTQEVPQHLRDSHYKGAKILGHGTGYKNPHFFKNVSQEYLQIPKKYYNFQENDKGKEQREDPKKNKRNIQKNG